MLEDFGQVAEEMVGDLAGGAVDDHETRLVAPVGRLLRDGGIRETVIELSRIHGGEVGKGLLRWQGREWFWGK